MVPFFSDCSGKSGKSGKAVFSTFFSDCPRKTGKSGKVVPVTASLTSHGLPQKIPLYRLFRFFPRTLQKMSRCPRVFAHRWQCLRCTKIRPETTPLAPIVAQAFLLPCVPPRNTLNNFENLEVRDLQIKQEKENFYMHRL